MEACRLHASATSMATRPVLAEAVFMSILVSIQKDLMELKERSKSWRSRVRAMRGWLLDLYPSGSNQLTLWIIDENETRIRLTDHYTPRIYTSDDLAEL